MNRCRLYIHSVDRCYINMHVLCVYMIIFVYVSIFTYLITLCNYWCFLGTGCITEVDTTLQVQVGTSLNEQCECFMWSTCYYGCSPPAPDKKGLGKGLSIIIFLQWCCLKPLFLNKRGVSQGYIGQNDFTIGRWWNYQNHGHFAGCLL